MGSATSYTPIEDVKNNYAHLGYWELGSDGSTIKGELYTELAELNNHPADMPYEGWFDGTVEEGFMQVNMIYDVNGTEIHRQGQDTYQFVPFE